VIRDDRTASTSPSPVAEKPATLLEVDRLRKYYPIEKSMLHRVVGHVKAVDDATFSIHEGETLGLVGESGCGKSTLGKCILRAIEPTEGSIRFRFPDNRLIDLMTLDRKELRALRRHMQMVFQDPSSSLNPRMTVLDIVGEPLLVNGIATGRQLEQRVKELMDVVGLSTTHLRRHPHAFSGGQKQRIGIARALATRPRFIVADEAVSALDVSIQAQILNLLADLQEQFQLTFLFISHNLSVVEHISDRVAVMYVGRLVELAPTEDLFHRPRHPYTEALLSAITRPDPDTKTTRIILSGEVANPAAPPPGCSFHPRCKYARDICHQEVPKWTELEPDHFCACHRAGELSLRGVR
jgi:peptide/nickel transport system ATP-binding protein